MSKKLPAITHLQFLVLGALGDGEQAGRHLRALLAAYGLKGSGPAFYQMMARLEEGGLVEGWYARQLVDGQHLKERRYRLLREGRRAVEETRVFYLQRASAARAVRKGTHA